MQRQREEKKARRQMELLQLVERNSPGNLTQKKGISPDESPSLQHECDAKNKVSTLRNMIILYSKGQYCTPPFVSSMDFNNFLLQTLWTDVDRTVPNMGPDCCPSEHHLDHDHI